MIIASLQEQNKYLERTQNPNYLIIVQNKAGQGMDFSQFKLIGLDGENYIRKESKRNKYLISCDPVCDRPGFVIIRVTDNGIYEAIGVTCKEDKKDKWIEKFKKDYSAVLIPKQDVPLTN